MYVHFDYANGSNPYITMTNKRLFDMVCKYHLTQIGNKAYVAMSERVWGSHDYKGKQAVLRDFAIQWQHDFNDFCYSWGDLADYGDFFEEYGRKYGLLGEFRENGIL